MRASNNIDELAKALAKAQGEMSGVKKGKTNPHFKTTYADLASAIAATREAFSENGLSFVQLTNSEPGSVDVSIVTRLMHESGQWIESVLNVRATQQTPQGLGSAITYGRRYSLMAMVGIAPEDDDGETASQKPPQTDKSSKQDKMNTAKNLPGITTANNLPKQEEKPKPSPEQEEWRALVQKHNLLMQEKDRQQIAKSTLRDATGHDFPLDPKAYDLMAFTDALNRLEELLYPENDIPY